MFQIKQQTTKFNKSITNMFESVKVYIYQQNTKYFFWSTFLWLPFLLFFFFSTKHYLRLKKQIETLPAHYSISCLNLNFFFLIKHYLRFKKKIEILPAHYSISCLNLNFFFLINIIWDSKKKLRYYQLTTQFRVWISNFFF